jgi:hypothetical protein
MSHWAEIQEEYSAELAAIRDAAERAQPGSYASPQAARRVRAGGKAATAAGPAVHAPRRGEASGPSESDVACVAAQ